MPRLQTVLNNIKKMAQSSEPIPIKYSMQAASQSPSDVKEMDKRSLTSRQSISLDPRERVRINRYAAFDQLILDEECFSMWNVVNECVFSGQSDTFSLEYKNGDKLAKLIEKKVFGEFDIGGKIQPFFAGAAHKGDAYFELVWESNKLSNITMHRPEDICIAKKDGKTFYIYQPTKRVIHPFMMIHYKFIDRGDDYGMSLFEAVLSAALYESVANETMNLSVINQNNSKVIATIQTPLTGRKEWEAELDYVRDSLEDAEIIRKDGVVKTKISGGAMTSPKIIPYKEDMDAPKITQIAHADLGGILEWIKFNQEKKFIATGVPAVLCGMERNVNARATSATQMDFFMRRCSKWRNDVVSIIVEIMEKCALLDGYFLEPGQIEVSMPEMGDPKEALNAEIQNTMSQTLKNLIDAGMSTKDAVEMVFGGDSR